MGKKRSNDHLGDDDPKESTSGTPVAQSRGSSPGGTFEETLTFEALRKKIETFANEREWNQFHTPRNLALALVGEVGELCEIFQWRGDNTSIADWDEKDRIHLGEELSDVLIYTLRLADKCNVDLPTAALEKMKKNSIKYPANLVRGSSKKYNEYKKRKLENPQ